MRLVCKNVCMGDKSPSIGLRVVQDEWVECSLKCEDKTLTLSTRLNLNGQVYRSRASTVKILTPDSEKKWKNSIHPLPNQLHSSHHPPRN
ncbi:hypothetical protein BgiMline_004725 [Biomphalaria glabrata]|nr:hypothetical protein BgiMline_002825 [Biomphalaria glabrata]